MKNIVLLFSRISSIASVSVVCIQFVLPQRTSRIIEVGNNRKSNWYKYVDQGILAQMKRIFLVVRCFALAIVCYFDLVRSIDRCEVIVSGDFQSTLLTPLAPWAMSRYGHSAIPTDNSQFTSPLIMRDYSTITKIHSFQVIANSFNVCYPGSWIRPYLLTKQTHQ